MKTITLLLLAATLTSCATMPSGVRGLREGMTRNDVKEEIGEPDGITRRDDMELLEYSNRMVPWTNNRADYFVVLRDNKVVSYGTGEIRQNMNNTTLFIPPFPQPTYQPMPPPPPLMPGYSR